jgi:hypothetical protein
MMTRRSLLLCAALLLVPLGAFAQEAPATPRPNFQEYNDDAMHFVAPSSYRPVGQRKVSLEDLSDDPQVVAAWVSGDATRPKRMLIQIQSYQGPLDGFEATYEQSLRNAFGDALIKNKDHTALKNGMPAVYFEMTSGTGFDASKMYVYCWVDGTRGVALSLTAQVGEMDTATAQRLLSNASAVRYPVGRG